MSLLRILITGFMIALLPMVVFAGDWSEGRTIDRLAGSVILMKISRTVSYNSLGEPGRYITKQQDTLGTGFLLLGEGSGQYLVTAAHVARLMDASALITVSTGTAKPVTVPLKSITGQPDPPAWTRHPTADVACLRVDLQQPMFLRLLESALSVAALESNETAPSRDDDLVLLGFPMGLGAVGEFSPISRKSHAASGMIRYQFPGEVLDTYFLLQDPSAEGYSGAPVFNLGSMPPAGLTRRDRIKIVGLVKGTLADIAGGQFAAIVPAKYIRETIALIPDR